MVQLKGQEKQGGRCVTNINITTQYFLAVITEYTVFSILPLTQHQI